MRLFAQMFPTPPTTRGARPARSRGRRQSIRPRALRGFTLIELMIVVSIISISATVTFASINRDHYQQAVENFSEELGAEVMRARDTAINLQTTVDVQFFPVGMSMSMVEPDTGNTVPLRFLRRSEFGGGRLGNEVCVVGVLPLIHAPTENVPTAIPLAACPTGGLESPFATLRFGPDGTYEVDSGSVQGYTRNGWTVVVRDGRSANPVFSLIDLFPTGLIRVIPHVKDGSE